MPDTFQEQPLVLVPQGDASPPIAKMCISVETSGILSESAEVTEKLEVSLGYFNVEVVSEGCDASLDLTVDGYRRSGQYTNAGTCWTGIAINGTSRLEIDGVVVAQGVVNLPGDPPYQALGCPDQNHPAGDHGFASELLAVPFREAFGIFGVMAIGMSFNIDPYETSGAVLGEGMQAMASLLLIAAKSADQDLLEAVGSWIGMVYRVNPDSRAVQLGPLVPYLIVMLGDEDLKREARSIISDLTGNRFSAPEEAWEWWEQQQP